MHSTVKMWNYLWCHQVTLGASSEYETSETTSVVKSVVWLSTAVFDEAIPPGSPWPKNATDTQSVNICWWHNCTGQAQCIMQRLWAMESDCVIRICAEFTKDSKGKQVESTIVWPHDLLTEHPFADKDMPALHQILELVTLRMTHTYPDEQKKWNIFGISVSDDSKGCFISFARQSTSLVICNKIPNYTDCPRLNMKCNS